MFETVTGFISALQQGGLLLAGGFLTLIGGFIVINNLHWQMYAGRVPAIITGVRRDGRIFYPVFRYTAPAGDTAEVVSDSGSTFLRGKDTGRAVVLRAFADDPQNIRSDLRGNFFIGLLFLLPGLLLLYVSWDDNLFSPVGAAGVATVVIFGFWRLRKRIIPQKDRLDKAEWKAQKRAERQARFDKLELTTIEAWRQTSEARSDAAKNARVLRIAMPRMLVGGLVLLFLAYNTGQRVMHLQENGLRAEGEITGFEKADGGGNIYYAIVRFAGEDGNDVHFTESAGSSHPKYKTGDDVHVLYLAQDPAGSAIIDSGGWRNWIWTGLMAGGGMLLLAGAALAWRSTRKQTP